MTEFEKLKALMDGVSAAPDAKQRELTRARDACTEIFEILEASGFPPTRASEILAMLAGVLAARTTNSEIAAFARGAELCTILLEAAISD